MKLVMFDFFFYKTVILYNLTHMYCFTFPQTCTQLPFLGDKDVLTLQGIELSFILYQIFSISISTFCLFMELTVKIKNKHAKFAKFS